MSGAPTPDRDLLGRITRLERTRDDLKRELEQLRQSLVRGTLWRQTLIAKTTTSGTYPTAPADTFEIVFCSDAASYTETAGNQTPSFTDHSASAQKFAHSLGDRYYPEDARVFVVEINGQYWIVGGEAIARHIDFYLDAQLTTSDQYKAATVEDYYDGASPGSTVNVYNRPLASGYGFRGASGARGMAVWDDRRGNYRIWQIFC